MEIRNVINEVKNDYPKIGQISKKHLSNSIPKKWLNVGLSSFGIAMIMKNQVFALSSTDTITTDIAGGFPLPIPTPIKICTVACPIVQIVSAMLFIITGLSILVTKIKAKKQNEPKKIKNWIKVLFIISIIVFILSFLAKFFIHIIGYY